MTDTTFQKDFETICEKHNVHGFGFAITKEGKDAQEGKFQGNGLIVASVDRVSQLTEGEIAGLVLMFRKQNKKFMRSVVHSYMTKYFERLCGKGLEAEKIAAYFAAHDREEIFEQSAHAVDSGDADAESVGSGCCEVHGRHPLVDIFENFFKGMLKKK